MTKSRNYEEELRHLCDAMADTVRRLTDEEILEQAHEDGIDAHAVAEELRAMAQSTSESVRLRPLRAARAKYERDAASLKNVSWRLPEAAAERRALLENTLTRRPELLGFVTAAARELKDVPDDDVTSMLRHLAALGVLDE